MSRKLNQGGSIGLGLIISIVLLVAAIGFVTYNVRQNDKKKAEKRATERTQLFSASEKLVATDCSEKSRSYQYPNLDASASWIIFYECPNDTTATYESLKQNAEKNAYQIVNSSNNSTSQNKSFEYTFDGYYAKYDISPSNKNSHDTSAVQSSIRAVLYRR